MCLFKSYKDTKKKKKGIDDFKCILQSCNSKASQSDFFLLLNSKWLTSLMWTYVVPVAIMANNHIIAFRKLATVCLW